MFSRTSFMLLLFYFLMTGCTEEQLAALSDKTEPVVSSIQVSEVTSSTAIVSFVTDEEASSEIHYADSDFYATNSSYNQTQVTADYKLAHRVLLENLQPQTNYNYQVSVSDRAGNITYSENLVFTTSGQEIAPPVITNPIPQSVTELPAGTSTTLLGITTDITAECRFSTSPSVSFEAMTEAFSSLDQLTHTSTVSGLTDASSYNYYVRCQNSSGHSNQSDFHISFSVAAAVVEDTTAPVITNVQATSLLPRSVVISFQTNEQARTLINYAESDYYAANNLFNQQLQSDALAQNHSVLLDNLNPSTTYHYQVVVTDSALNRTTSSNMIFTTDAEDTSPPVISDPIPEQAAMLPSGTVSTTLGVSTDEYAECRYSATADTSYDDMSGRFSSSGQTTHEATVTGLEDGASYTFYVRCEDGEGYVNERDFQVSFSVAELVVVDPCDGVSCSSQGVCVVVNNSASCQCDLGYHSQSLECVADSPLGCVEKNMGYSNAEQTRRHLFAFPVVNGQPSSTIVESACLTVSGLSSPINIGINRGEYSINDGEWLDSSTDIQISNGDTIKRRIETPADADAEQRWAYLMFREADGDYFTGEFAVRSANNDRAPQLFQVGPERSYRQLTEIVDLLRAGDLVELDGDATYESVEFTRAGLPDLPITIRGISVNGQRPVISGGTWTVSLNGSHHMRLENLEITGGSVICLRHMANDITVTQSYIHHCERHGILGADEGSGTLVIDRVEVSHSGGQPAGEHLMHPVYVATDRDRYPNSKLKVMHSYIHDFEGNGIKSRSARNEIYYNWIEVPDLTHAFYSIELPGFEAYQSVPGIDSDIVGNVLIHHGATGVRAGGDGTGVLRGRLRMVNNTLLFGEAFSDYTPAIRLYGALDSIYLANNIFHEISSAPTFRLWRNDVTDWVSGEIKLLGYNNWAPTGSDFGNDGSRWPDGMSDTLFGDAPGFTSGSDFASLNLLPLAGGDVSASGLADNGGGNGYAIDGALTTLDYQAPSQRPVSGSILEAIPRTSSGWNIGAH